MKTTTRGLRIPIVIGVGIILVGSVAAAGWYFFAKPGMASQDTARQNDIAGASSSATDVTAAQNTDDPYEGWKTFSWSSQSLQFKYQAGWHAEEDPEIHRVVVRNKQAAWTKDAVPADARLLWISADGDEASLERETAIKQGASTYRMVAGPVTADTVKAGSLSIATYTYETVGGLTIEAYWTAQGKRFMATTATELGQEQQQMSVETLESMLPTIMFN